MVWDHFLLVGPFTVILTKKTVDSQVCFKIGKVFQIYFKLWTTCVCHAHLSRPLPLHCASYSIWRCHIHIYVEVRNCDFAEFSPKFSWLWLFYVPYEKLPQPLQILPLNSLSKLHSKSKSYFFFLNCIFRNWKYFLVVDTFASTSVESLGTFWIEYQQPSGKLGKEFYFGEEKKILELCFPIQDQKYLLHKVNKRYSASKLLKITWWPTCGKLKASNKAFCQT